MNSDPSSLLQIRPVIFLTICCKSAEFLTQSLVNPNPAVLIIPAYPNLGSLK
nr:MAG TPA: hypothetical protein [Bacteriophage sp.]